MTQVESIRVVLRINDILSPVRWYEHVKERVKTPGIMSKIIVNEKI